MMDDLDLAPGFYPEYTPEWRALTDRLRAELSRERELRAKAEAAEIEAREAVRDTIDNARKALVTIITERDAAIARAEELQRRFEGAMRECLGRTGVGVRS